MDPALPLPLPLRQRLARPLALWFRGWAQRRHRPGPDAALRAARATMARKKYCLLATLGDEGVAARVLQPFPPSDELEVWLGTSPGSRKVAQLEADPRATLVYEDDAKSACVVLTGRVEVVRALEERRRRFMPTWWAFWPEGPDSPDYALLRFVPDRLEVWDAARGITPEPFGLRATRLVRREGAWREA